MRHFMETATRGGVYVVSEEQQNDFHTKSVTF